MEEPFFWKALEYRVCREFSGFEDARLRHYWCDGFNPGEYELDGEEPCIRGTAWCGPSGQEEWGYTLLLGRTTASRNEIDWSALLPDDRITGWLTPDPASKTLRIDPLSGSDDQR
jgi:hypothetical protein